MSQAKKSAIETKAKFDEITRLFNEIVERTETYELTNIQGGDKTLNHQEPSDGKGNVDTDRTFVA